MFRIAYIAASAASLLSVDVTQVYRLRQQTENQAKIRRTTRSRCCRISTRPEAPRSRPSPRPPSPAGPLTEEYRLQILRDVSGEFARMVTSLPAGKNGFRIKAGEPVDKSDASTGRGLRQAPR